jgi:PadR family transcriptional regulator PadR
VAYSFLPLTISVERLMRDFDDLRHGTLDVLVLKALSWEPSHGYAIAKWVGDRASGELAITDAALYKALHRLESEGAIQGKWGLSENNRRAKYYSLTARGQKALRSELAAWRRYSRAVNAVLETT